MSLLDRIVQRSQERDRLLVTHPASMRRVAGGVAALLALVMFASSRPLWAEPGSWADVLGLLLALLAGLAVASSLRVKLAYRSGWLEGRRAMVHALVEAQAREIPPADWLMGELERDYAVLGLDPSQAHADVERPEEEL
jgi:hypothetical protein